MKQAAAKTGTKEESKPDWLDEIIQRIVAVAAPEKIILFGSAARDEMGPNSDVDLLVVKSGIAHRGQIGRTHLHEPLWGRPSR
ncbi:MAG: nucleotidyltransferase domain-containing protein [Anaerolineae bacterium]